MTTEIQEYSATEASLAELRTQYHGVIFDCTKPKDMKDARAARAKIVRIRTTLEKARVKTKAEALKYCQLVDSEAGRIKKEILALEDPITQQIKKEETRKAEIKAKKLREEQEELQKFRTKIEAIRRRPLDFINATPDQILQALIRARNLGVDDFPAELRSDAFDALEGAIKKLEEMHIAALDAADRDTRLEQAETVVDVSADEPVVSAETAEPKVIEALENRVRFNPVRETDPFTSKGPEVADDDESPERVRLMGESGPFTSKGPDSAAQRDPPGNPLLTAAKAACQYLEADPNSKNHIVTKNLRSAINHLS